MAGADIAIWFETLSNLKANNVSKIFSFIPKTKVEPDEPVVAKSESTSEWKWDYFTKVNGSMQKRVFKIKSSEVSLSMFDQANIMVQIEDPVHKTEHLGIMRINCG